MKTYQCANRMSGEESAAGKFFPVFVGALSPELPTLEFSWGCFKKSTINYEQVVDEATQELIEVRLHVHPSEATNPLCYDWMAIWTH